MSPHTACPRSLYNFHRYSYYMNKTRLLGQTVLLSVATNAVKYPETQVHFVIIIRNHGVPLLSDVYSRHDGGVRAVWSKEDFFKPQYNCMSGKSCPILL